MKKITFPVFLFLFLTHCVFSQNDETLFGESGLKLTGFWGGPNIGLSTFDEETAPMRGGFFGVELNKAVLLGVGNLKTEGGVRFNNGQADSEFDLRYKGLLLGFTPQLHRVIHPKFGFLMGGGKLKIKGESDDDLFVVQPSGGFEVNVFRWFRAGVEGGYRFVSGTNTSGLQDDDLSSFYAGVNLRFGWSWGK